MFAPERRPNFHWFFFENVYSFGLNMHSTLELVSMSTRVAFTYVFAAGLDVAVFDEDPFLERVLAIATIPHGFVYLSNASPSLGSEASF